MKHCKKFLAFCLTLVLLALSLPGVFSVSAEGAQYQELDLSNGSIVITATDYAVGGADPVAWTGNYIIKYTGGGSNLLTVKGAACDIIFDNVKISTLVPAVLFDQGADVNLILRGENSVIFTDTAKTGTAIGVGADSTLTIDAESETDSLDVIGGAYGAGIGSVQDSKTISAKIVINGGVITASAGHSNASEAAGIGGARNSGAQVVINGGVITATGVRNGSAIGAGRGAPDGTTVTINGGIITATSLTNGAAIGAAYQGNAAVTVNGGVINAYAAHQLVKGISTKGMNSATDAAAPVINGGSIYSFNNKSQAVEDYSTGTVKKVTVALPEGATAPYTLSVNGVEKTYSALNADGNLNLYVPVAASYTVITAGKIAKTTSAIAAADWKAPSADLVYAGYQEADRGDTRDIRFCAALKNHEAYSTVGFTVLINGDAVKVFEGNTNKIYTSLNGTDANGVAFVAVTATEHNADGVFAAVLRNLPETGSYTLTVIATAADAQGAEVYTEAYEYTVANGVLTIVD